MSALASTNAALNVKVRGANVREAKASTVVYGYSLVMRDSTDKIVPLGATAGIFEGVLNCDTILAAATERKCTVSPEGLILCAIAGVAITDLDKPVFCSTDNPADALLTQAAGAKKIGRVKELHYDASGAVSGKCWVELETGLKANDVIEHVTADRTLLRGESGKTFTNLGAAGAVTITLPQDAPQGTKFHFVVMAAQQLRLDPGAAGALYINGAKQTDDAYANADDEGETTTLTADGNGDWIASGTTGTWTVV